MTRYSTEVDVSLGPDDESYVTDVEETRATIDDEVGTGYDLEAAVPGFLDDDEVLEPEAVEPPPGALEVGIFVPDEVFEADEHALHDHLASEPRTAGADDEDYAEEETDDLFVGEAPITERVQAALRQGFWAVAVRLMIATGERDEKRLTNLVFQSRHPEIGKRAIRPDEKHLAAEWLTIRDQIIRPLLPGRSRGRRPAVLRSAAIRAAWHEYLDAKDRMTDLLMFGRWNTPVNPETVEAWRAFERALTGAGYMPHRAWVFNPRDIAKTNTPSLHAYGLAIDIDHREPKCNVNRPTPDGRKVGFSDRPTKDERCADVRNRRADTSFTPAQVAAVESIRTVDGYQVFTWGGRWKTTKDTMHFQINVTPEELRRGLA